MLLGATDAVAQQQERGLFRRTDRVRADAIEARADILAPRSFGQAMRRYQEAERDLERGRDREDIENKLREARQYFEQSIEIARLGYPVLAPALEARDDAERAEASDAAAGLWQEGVDKFEEAARKMEGGDVGGARERTAEAETIFRQAELAAIKADYLQDTWNLLGQARETKLRERAPRSFARAEGLVAQAETLLEEDRYDTEEPRALASEAMREAEHATYLAGIVFGVEEEEQTFEDVMLAAEDELRTIANVMDVEASFENGLSETTAAIVRRTERYQDDIRRLRRELNDREEELDELGTRIVTLEEQLGGLAEERTALVRRMEEQARLRQKFATVERMFSREEARVMRESGDVIIRLLGFTFPVGESIIDPQHHDVLNRVLRAIQEFPDSRITVEGHTDSVGSSAKNQSLSQERADAVRRYILDAMRMDPSLIDAVGYGESRPIASNGTQAGRAQNRRIEITIHTAIGMGY
jgi:outer membrane protein OmpA-like peptidoglycan-associated protein